MAGDVVLHARKPLACCADIDIYRQSGQGLSTLRTRLINLVSIVDKHYGWSYSCFCQHNNPIGKTPVIETEQTSTCIRCFRKLRIRTTRGRRSCLPCTLKAVFFNPRPCYSKAQLEAAMELIEDGGIVRSGAASSAPSPPTEPRSTRPPAPHAPAPPGRRAAAATTPQRHGWSPDPPPSRRGGTTAPAPPEHEGQS